MYLFLLLAIMACTKSNEVNLNNFPDSNLNDSLWIERAQNAYDDLFSVYWNPAKNRFYSDNYKNTNLNYWWQAHALDALVDEKIRTMDTTGTEMTSLINGIKEVNNNSLINSFYDDMEWLALALLRSYMLTGETSFLDEAKHLWEEIQKGWNTKHDGGIAWNKSQTDYKNMPANAPAVILSYKFYQLEKNVNDSIFGNKVLTWVENNLVDEYSGKVYDGLGRDGTDQVDKEWQFTYNYGIFIGACVEKYHITKDYSYIEKAVKSADYAICSLVKPGTEILKDEGIGDGGLFKGIFIRYLTSLIEVDAITDASRQKFIGFLNANAESLWNMATVQNPYIQFSSDWTEPPSRVTDLSVQLSGQFMLEILADLERKKLL